MAFEAMERSESSRFVALLEYEWMTGKDVIEMEAIDMCDSLIGQTGGIYETVN